LTQYPVSFDLETWTYNTVAKTSDAIHEDPLTQWCMSAAAAAIEHSAGRSFTKVAEPQAGRTKLGTSASAACGVSPVVDEHPACGHYGHAIIEIDDLMTTDDLAIEIDGNPVTDFTLLPRNAAQKDRPWTEVEIPGFVHGWVTITRVGVGWKYPRRSVPPQRSWRRGSTNAGDRPPGQ